ncbi:hypothetical protein EV424DRAFT_1585852 [Suillus variegatus]|nr:hypothetical protein EV424DRAFT_1585852 [Suillus variegatus]
MSHVSWPSTADSSESDSEWDGQNTADADHISIPGPGASKGELLEMLKMLQVQMQKLQEENRTIKEENKTLHAEKPNIHEETISIYACKYGMMIEMFPSSDLLNKRLPDSPTPFDSTDQYATASTQESAFLDELYRHFPESLHKVMESSYFSDLVMKSIPDARANEIKKLRGVAGDIFNLPSKYFTNTSYDRANVPEIQRLLGVTSSTNLVYKTFPPKLASVGTNSESFVAWYHIPPSHFQWQRRTYQLHEMEHSASHTGLHRLGHSSSLDMESSDDGTETAADVTGPGTPTAAALERHVNALASESISQPILSTQRRHTTEAPIVNNVATNNGTAADLEDAAAATPQADEVGAAVISSSGEPSSDTSSPSTQPSNPPSHHPSNPLSLMSLLPINLDQQAVYCDGRNPTFWCSIGVLYFQINQFHDALDACSRAIHINCYISKVWFDLGSLYESCNNQISDAIDAYARASELNPGNHVISQCLQLLKNAQATGGQLPAAPGPQDVHPTAYASAVVPPPGLTGPPPATIDVHSSPNLLASVKQLKYGHTLSDYNIQTALISPLANGVSHLHWQAAQTRPYPF